MSEKNTGGPAFPSGLVENGEDQVDALHKGMTLRDYFAGQALIACRNHSNAEWLAKRAYQIADAMMSARGTE